MDDVTLTRTLCAALGALPGWEFREKGPAYPATVVGVFYGTLKDSPDRAAAVQLYSPTDEDHLTIRRAQVIVRGRKGDRYDADRLAGHVFLALHRLSRVGGISDIRRISGGPLGADNNGREERSDNYQITLNNPEASSP